MDDDLPILELPFASGTAPRTEQVPRCSPDRGGKDASAQSAVLVDPGNDDKPAQKDARLTGFAERAQAPAETSRLLEENRLLSRRLVSVREEERRRLARALHNEIGQYLTALRSEIQRLSILHAGSTPPVRESARILVALCDRVQDLTRQILHGLAPPTLIYEAGLAEALNELVRAFRRHHGDIRFYLALNRLPQGTDTDVAAVVYRVIQEAMTNAARHAAASRVLVGVRGSPSAEAPAGLRIVVRDNGCGFDPGSVAYTVGLDGMRESVHAFGGRLSIRSRPGSGTRVEANLPVTVSDG